MLCCFLLMGDMGTHNAGGVNMYIYHTGCIISNYYIIRIRIFTRFFFY